MKKKKSTKVKWFSLYMYQHLIWSHYFFYLVLVCAGDGGCWQFATSTGNNTKERRIEDNVMNAMNRRLLFSRSQAVVLKQRISLYVFCSLILLLVTFFPLRSTQSKNCFNNSRKKNCFRIPIIKTKTFLYFFCRSLKFGITESGEWSKKKLIF